MPRAPCSLRAAILLALRSNLTHGFSTVSCRHDLLLLTELNNERSRTKQNTCGQLCIGTARANTITCQTLALPTSHHLPHASRVQQTSQNKTKGIRQFPLRTDGRTGGGENSMPAAIAFRAGDKSTTMTGCSTHPCRRPRCSHTFSISTAASALARLPSHRRASCIIYSPIEIEICDPAAAPPPSIHPPSAP